jgi:hypothetical protein
MTTDLIQVYLKIVFVFRTFVLTTVDQGGEDARRRSLPVHLMEPMGTNHAREDFADSEAKIENNVR